MKLYYSLLIVIAILCNFFCSASYALPSLPAPQATHLPQELAEFYIISVRGPIHLSIDQIREEEPNFMQFSGEKSSPVSAHVKDGILYLQAEESEKLTHITVGIHRLTQLIIEGNAAVTAKKLASTGLSIDANTSGAIELLGMVSVDRILSSGRGPIHIQWINSPRLRVDGSDSSTIELAGVVGMVEMRLRDHSQFQGQYLRIDRIFIQTKDYSVAKVLVNDSMRAFAYDHSNIYYYKRPTELTEFTSGSGNILQLGWGK